MSDVLVSIDNRIIQLKNIINEIQRELDTAPEGTINISQIGEKIYYYQKIKNSDINLGQQNSKESIDSYKRKYIRKSEHELIQALCQKDYNIQVLQAAQKELVQLERLKKNYPKKVCEDIYQGLGVARSCHVNPIHISDEEYIKKWKQEEYIRKGFGEDAPEFITDRGEQVRSKTEILIANALNKYRIPYHYEKPLYLSGFGKIHPDFTVLNVRLRKEMYWEHLGMLDNEDYREDAFRRITLYEKNNYFPGDKLILTHETRRYPISPRNIESNILKYLT